MKNILKSIHQAGVRALEKSKAQEAKTRRKGFLTGGISSALFALSSVHAAVFGSSAAYLLVTAPHPLSFLVGSTVMGVTAAGFGAGAVYLSSRAMDECREGLKALKTAGRSIKNLFGPKVTPLSEVLTQNPEPESKLGQAELAAKFDAATTPAAANEKTAAPVKTAQPPTAK